jgi:hypothetical protein
MGNTQSGYTLTRTAATLDSFISELGPEIVYGERYALRLLAPRPSLDDVGSKSWVLTLSEDCSLPTSERSCSCENLHQTRPENQFAEVSKEAER